MTVAKGPTIPQAQTRHTVAELRQLLVTSRQTALDIRPQPLTRVADRKVAIKEQLENFQLDDLKAKLINYLDLITTFQGDEVILNPQFSELVMRQKIATRDIAELADVVDKAIKKIVFDSMNASNAEDPDIEDPVNINSEIIVSSMGMRFAREGAGVTISANIPALKKALADAGIDWTSVFDTQRTVTYTLNTAALWETVKDKDDDVKNAVIATLEEKPKDARLRTYVI